MHKNHYCNDNNKIILVIIINLEFIVFFFVIIIMFMCIFSSDYSLTEHYYCFILSLFAFAFAFVFVVFVCTIIVEALALPFFTIWCTHMTCMAVYMST